MRDRLIELQSKAWIEWQRSTTDVDFAEYCAAHLIAEGVIVPPVKVGDKAFFIVNGKIYRATVRYLRWEHHKSRGVFAEMAADINPLSSVIASFDDIGYTVFLTKAGAQAALQKGAEK